MEEDEPVAGRNGQFEGLEPHELESHRRLLFRIAHGVLRDASAAEDACQQALLQLWRQDEALRDRSAARAWLAKAVMNESLQLLRRRRIEQRAVLEQSRRRAANWRDAEHEPVVRESVLLALAELPEAERIVVALRIMQGMSGNDVSDLLGCSAAEVSRRLHRGMEQLRRLLADWKDEI